MLVADKAMTARYGKDFIHSYMLSQGNMVSCLSFTFFKSVLEIIENLLKLTSVCSFFIVLCGEGFKLPSETSMQ